MVGIVSLKPLARPAGKIPPVAIVVTAALAAYAVAPFVGTPFFLSGAANTVSTAMRAPARPTPPQTADAALSRPNVETESAPRPAASPAQSAASEPVERVPPAPILAPAVVVPAAVAAVAAAGARAEPKRTIAPQVTTAAPARRIPSRPFMGAPRSPLDGLGVLRGLMNGFGGGRGFGGFGGFPGFRGGFVRMRRF